MRTLAELTAAIEAILHASELLDGVDILVEDAAELENKIDKSMDEQGMLVLIGQPIFENQTPLSRRANFLVKIQIAIGENPLLWRDDPLTVPKAVEVTQIVVRLLQGITIAGFAPLRVQRADFVPDKKRQLYELSVETLLMFDPL